MAKSPLPRRSSSPSDYGPHLNYTPAGRLAGRIAESGPTGW